MVNDVVSTGWLNVYGQAAVKSKRIAYFVFPGIGTVLGFKTDKCNYFQEVWKV